MAREEDVAEVLAEAGIEVAYLFGPRARGEHRDSSDADIGVLAGRPLSLMERERLADLLAGALGAPDVDVIVLEEAPLELRGRVVQEGRAIFSADESRRVAFEVRTRSEYLDFLPVLEAHTRRFIRQVAERGL